MRRTTAEQDRPRRADAPHGLHRRDDPAGLDQLQSSVGNRALGGLLAPVQRIPEDGPVVGGGASIAGMAGIAGDVLSWIGGGLSALQGYAAQSPTAAAAVLALQSLNDGARVQVIEMLLTRPLDDAGKETMRQLWSGFGLERLPRVIADHSALWDRCNAAGANLPATWVGAGAGHVTKNVNEQVGANVYGVRGMYDYRVTEDAITITVGMNFQPDQGVTVPTATWFGYIASTWNVYDAVNLDDPTQRKRVDFQPVAGSGATIQVSAGTGRANAAHYYVGDDRAPQTVPHEFGHLIGLEDEYERDAADYERITETTVPTEDSPEGDGKVWAEQLHDALTLARSDDESETAVVARRQQAVQDILTDAHITPNYQYGENAWSHEVAAAYKEKYGHEISADIMAMIRYTETTEPDALRDWRERFGGTFQYTSTSIMGDMSDHSHPVEARHIRGFLAPLGQVFGGRWQPMPRG